jgi:hypothetical protein
VQVHCPLVLSHNCIAAHEAHVLPAPHCASDCCAKGKHVAASAQQPVVHELAVHTHDEPLHSRPAPQVLHVSPPTPHAVLPGVVTHRLSASQHPAAHVVALQPMTTSAVLPESDASRVDEPSWASTVSPPSCVLGPSLSVETSAIATSEVRASTDTSDPCASLEMSKRASEVSRGGASARESVSAASIMLVSRVPGASLPLSLRVSAADPVESVGPCRSAEPSRLAPSKSEPPSATLGGHVAVSSHGGSSPHAVGTRSASPSRATRGSWRWLIPCHTRVTSSRFLGQIILIVVFSMAPAVAFEPGIATSLITLGGAIPSMPLGDE